VTVTVTVVCSVPLLLCCCAVVLCAAFAFACVRSASRLLAECASQPCANGATCVEETDSFRCACAVGWAGRLCTSDIDECASSPCAAASNTYCVDRVGSYLCAINATVTIVPPDTVPALSPDITGVNPSVCSQVGGELISLTAHGFNAFALVLTAEPDNTTLSTEWVDVPSAVSIAPDSLGRPIYTLTVAACPSWRLHSGYRRFNLTVVLADDPSADPSADDQPATSTGALSRTLSVTTETEAFGRLSLPSSSVDTPSALSVSLSRFRPTSTADGDAGVLVLPFVVFYPLNPCTAPGEFFQTIGGQSVCSACPDGAECPGGGRAWPLPGYWSYNEFSAPVRCAGGVVACPGATGQDTAYPARLNADGSRDTRRCTSAYRDDFCADCAEDHYRQESLCRFCGDSSAGAGDGTQPRWVLGAAVVFFVVLSVCVALLSTRYLSYVVSGAIVLQQIVTVGGAASTLLVQNKTISQVFNYMSLINFDVQMVSAMHTLHTAQCTRQRASSLSALFCSVACQLPTH
jgi:hypothetical protein